MTTVERLGRPVLSGNAGHMNMVQKRLNAERLLLAIKGCVCLPSFLATQGNVHMHFTPPYSS